MGKSNRYWPVLIGSALACAMLGSGVAAAQERPIVIGHRGAALSMPENTIPAFDFAVRAGVEMLEFDIQMTKDRQLIVTHDTRVNPAFCTTKRRGGAAAPTVRESTLAELLKFDCGSKRRPLYPTQRTVPGTKMPTLDAVLKRYARTDVKFFGELKMPTKGDGTVDPVEFTRLLASAIRKHGLTDRFILQSFDWRTIDAMHVINPRVRTCLLGVRRAQGDFLAVARKHNARCMTLRDTDVDVAQVRALKSAGIMLVSDVIDTEAAWRKYLDLEFDAIFTNDPKQALEFLDRAVPRAGRRGSPRAKSRR